MDRNQIRGSEIRKFYLEIHSQQPLKNGKAAIEVGLMNGGKVPHSRHSALFQKPSFLEHTQTASIHASTNPVTKPSGC
jgi:hypothetical protein